MHLSTISYVVWLMLSHASWTAGKLQCVLVLTVSLFTLFLHTLSLLTSTAACGVLFYSALQLQCLQANFPTVWQVTKASFKACPTACSNQTAPGPARRCTPPIHVPSIPSLLQKCASPCDKARRHFLSTESNIQWWRYRAVEVDSLLRVSKQ